MTEMTLETLTRTDLTRHQDIFAVTPSHERKRVWDSRRLLPFVGSDHPGTLVERGYIHVESFAPEHLAPLYAKLTEIHGDRRLQR